MTQQTRLASVSRSRAVETGQAGRTGERERGEDRPLADCPACGGAPASTILEQESVPVHSCLLLETAEDAAAFPRGSIELAVCSSCGCIWNRAFDATQLRYAHGYEDTQSGSARFREFAHEVISELVTHGGIRGTSVVEVGCGRGADFLRTLCELGSNVGIGIDPAVDLDAAAGRSDLTLVAATYPDPRTALRAALFVCRHTLEHHHAPGEFARALVRNAEESGGALVYLEVPDAGRVLGEGAVRDVYYEHCCYFDWGSFERLAVMSGLEVESIARGFDDQYLLLRGRPARGRASRPAGTARLTDVADVDRLLRLASRFSELCASQRERWNGSLADLRATGRRAALWGSGSKAVAFLTTLDAGQEVECVVDINPRKQGKYMAGVSQQIVAPEQLADTRPEVVIVMNPTYRGEIERELEHLGLRPELLVL